MSQLYVCKEYETPYSEGYKVIRSIEEHNKIIYNQALEDFSKKMKEVNLTNSFVLYYGDKIDLEEFMNLASDEIKEELMK